MDMTIEEQKIEIAMQYWPEVYHPDRDEIDWMNKDEFEKLIGMELQHENPSEYFAEKRRKLKEENIPDREVAPGTSYTLVQPPTPDLEIINFMIRMRDLNIQSLVK